jgi:hypothetical protein
MPREAEHGEEPVGPGEELVVASRDTERAQSERLDGRPGLHEQRSLVLDPIVAAESDEGVESSREDPGPPDEGPLHGQLDE